MSDQRTVENGWRTSEENCPHCGVSLQGDPVPEKYLTHDPDCSDPDNCFCFPYGRTTHFSRKIGVEVWGVYDGVLYWACPDCGGKWHRWRAPDMRALAQPYVDAVAMCESCDKPTVHVLPRRPTLDDDYTINVGPCCDPTLHEECEH